MSKVFFIPMAKLDEEGISRAARQLFREVLARENMALEDEVPLKVHFGEKGNVTFLGPGCYQGIVEELQQRDVETSYIETNVLYRGSRTTRDSHIALAKDHGFTNLPILIADGDHGEAVTEVPINGEIFDSVKLGEGFSAYDQIVVLAHFKGHVEAGFGGAMKQLAMGFASRSGKMAQHATVNPKVNQEECISCGACLDACNYGAIELDGTAAIDPEVCVGCAACVAVCPVGAIKTDWSATDFKKRVAEYAYGAGKDRRNIYINFAFNITPYCDCYDDVMEPVADNLGVFASLDPVAIDRACLDMVQAKSDEKLFDEGRESLDHAEKLGLGSQTVDLIELELRA